MPEKFYTAENDDAYTLQMVVQDEDEKGNKRAVDLTGAIWAKLDLRKQGDTDSAPIVSGGIMTIDADQTANKGHVYYPLVLTVGQTYEGRIRVKFSNNKTASFPRNEGEEQYFLVICGKQISNS
jgi:hypothetical protein